MPLKNLQQRIEKDARDYSQDSPHFIFEYRGYVSGANNYYNTGWNEALNAAIEKLQYSPGGVDRYTIDKLNELRINR